MPIQGEISGKSEYVQKINVLPEGLNRQNTIQLLLQCVATLNGTKDKTRATVESFFTTKTQEPQLV